MNYKELDLNLIKVFLCVYECKSILLASKKLYISQPAVTKSIKKLENFLNGTLFIRTSKGLVPTQEGEEFNSVCYKTLNYLQNGIDNFEQYTKNNKGTINIGSSSTIIRKLLMPFLKKFTIKYPNISLSITDANSQKLLKYLTHGDIDFAILNTPVENHQSFNLIPIKQTFDCIIASKDFKKDFVYKEDLSKYPLILQKRPSNNRDFIDKICINNNIELKPKYEIGSFGLITDFVKNNMGIAFTVKDFVQNEILNNEIKEISSNLKFEPRQIVVISLKQEKFSINKQVFIKEIISYFNK